MKEAFLPMILPDLSIACVIACILDKTTYTQTED